MSELPEVKVAIVDYELGNLFSVKHACERAGMSATITSAAAEILAADCVILPGVGAFANAMATLKQLDLVEPIRDVAASGTLLVGICLGMQILMSESYEFGRHKGLGLVEGDVVRLAPGEGDRAPKVPQIGWNSISPAPGGAGWTGTPLAAVDPGSYMYFVHSYHVRPAHASISLATTTYGEVEFCSSLVFGNVVACQFHPERSGLAGLEIYRAIAAKSRGEDPRNAGSEIRTA